MYKQEIDVMFNKEIMLLRFYIFLKYNINEIDFMQVYKIQFSVQ